MRPERKNTRGKLQGINERAEWITCCRQNESFFGHGFVSAAHVLRIRGTKLLGRNMCKIAEIPSQARYVFKAHVKSHLLYGVFGLEKFAFYVAYGILGNELQSRFTAYPHAYRGEAAVGKVQLLCIIVNLSAARLCGGQQIEKLIECSFAFIKVVSFHLHVLHKHICQIACRRSHERLHHFLVVSARRTA